MPRTYKKDREATARAHFKDPRSYVSLRIHPGQRFACVYLKGEDVGAVRERIRCWYNYSCAECGRYCSETGHLHHIVGGLGAQRCWCEVNLIWLCELCHKDKHVQISWSRWAKKEEEAIT